MNDSQHYYRLPSSRARQAPPSSIRARTRMISSSERREDKRRKRTRASVPCVSPSPGGNLSGVNSLPAEREKKEETSSLAAGAVASGRERAMFRATGISFPSARPMVFKEPFAPGSLSLSLSSRPPRGERGRRERRARSLCRSPRERGRRSARARTRGPAESRSQRRTGSRQLRERSQKKTITLNGGSLGSWVDEERS